MYALLVVAASADYPKNSRCPLSVLEYPFRAKADILCAEPDVRGHYCLGKLK